MPSRRDMIVGVSVGLFGQVAQVYAILMTRHIFRDESILMVNVVRFGAGALGLWLAAALAGESSSGVMTLIKPSSALISIPKPPNFPDVLIFKFW